MQLRLSLVLRETKPTVADVVSRFADSDLSDLEMAAAFTLCSIEYDNLNTELYFLLRPSLDFSGEHEKDDADKVMSFHDGDLRNGHGLYMWVSGFVDAATLNQQQVLRVEVDSAKLSAGANLDQLEIHSKSLLRKWLAIEGNQAGHPMGFYHRLLGSLQIQSGANTPLVEVKKWIITKMTPKRDYFTSPAVFIDEMVKTAELQVANFLVFPGPECQEAWSLQSKEARTTAV